MNNSKKFRPAKQPQPEQQRDDAQRRPDEDASERVEFLLKRCALVRARLFNQSGDAAQLGVHRRGHDDGLPSARRDAGAHEHHVLAVAERDVALFQSRGLLRHRLRLAGQRGLDALERGGFQKPGISRNQVAGFQREDVAGDDSRGRNRSDLPVASHLGLRRGHLFERRDGLLRVELLVEADDGVEDDDGEDGDGIHHFAQHAGDDAGHDENPDDEALELAEENLQRADALAFFQLVRAVGREALCCFRCRKSGRCGAELCQHFLGRLAVPGFSFWLCGDGGCCGHAMAPVGARRWARFHFHSSTAQKRQGAMKMVRDAHDHAADATGWPSVASVGAAAGGPEDGQQAEDGRGDGHQTGADALQPGLHHGFADLLRRS